MAQCSADRLIRLDECLPEDNYTLVDLTPVAALLPNQSNCAKLISYYIMKLVSVILCIELPVAIFHVSAAQVIKLMLSSMR